MINASLAADYCLLASAIAARDTTVYFDNVRLAYSNGTDIYLPKARDERTVFGLFTQSLLLHGNSLASQYMLKCVARPKLAQRYLMLELRRIITKEKYLLPLSAYPFFIDHTKGVPKTQSSDESIALAYSNLVIPRPHKSFGEILPHKVLSKQGWFKRDEPASLNKKDKVNAVEADETDKEDEDSSGPSLLSSPITSDNFLMQLFKDHIQNQRRSSKASTSAMQGDELASNNHSSEGDVNNALAEKVAVVQQTVAAIKQTANSKTYPEWNCETQRYRDAWCDVHMMLPAVSEASTSTKPRFDDALQQRLFKFSTAYQKHNHRSDGELVDLRGLIDYTTARLAGSHADERLYTARLRTGHDLGVLVLLDASGSLSEMKADSARVWDQQSQLMHNLVTSLEAAGDRVAAYAFRSYSRHDVRFLSIKTFDNDFNYRSLQHLDAIEPKGFTRMGAALRHAAHLLETQAGTQKKLVLCISDGHPYERDYEGIYAQKDRLKAIQEMQGKAIGCVFLNLGSDIDPTDIAQLNQVANYVHLDEPFALSYDVHAVFNTALKSALAASFGQAL